MINEEGENIYPLRPLRVELIRKSYDFIYGFEYYPSRAWRRKIVRWDVAKFANDNVVFDGFRVRAVVGRNRSGKSVSVIYGVLEKLIVHEVPNYVVVIALQNHQQLSYALRVVLNSLNAIKNKYMLSWDELFRRVRVRYYRGQEHACLLNYLPDSDIRKYAFGEPPYKPSSSRCRRCPLYEEYGREWNRLPPVPVMTNDILVESGFCPFKAMFHKNFYYKSVVLVPYELLEVVVSQIRRFRIKGVVFIVDEYLDAMVRRVELPRRLVKDFELDDPEDEGAVRDYVRVVNEFLDELWEVAWSVYRRSYFPYSELSYKGWDGFVGVVKKWYPILREVFFRVDEVRKKLLRRGDYRYIYVATLLRPLRELLFFESEDVVVGASRALSVVRNVIRGRGGESVDVRGIFICLVSADRRRLVLGVGSKLRSALYPLYYDALVEKRVSVALFLVSSMRFVLGGHGGVENEYLPFKDPTYGFYRLPDRFRAFFNVNPFVLPTPNLPPVRDSPLYRFGLSQTTLYLVNKKTDPIWYVVVLNKEMLMGIVGSMFDKAEGVRVEGDRVVVRVGGLEVIVRGELERGIVDYVVVPSRKLLFCTGFGRVSKGVDVDEIPRHEPVYVIFVNTMRLPPAFFSIRSSLDPYSSYPVRGGYVEGSGLGSYGVYRYDERSGLYVGAMLSNEMVVWCMNVLSQLLGRFTHSERSFLGFTIANWRSNNYRGGLRALLTVLDWIDLDTPRREDVQKARSICGAVEAVSSAGSVAVSVSVAVGEEETDYGLLDLVGIDLMKLGRYARGLKIIRRKLRSGVGLSDRDEWLLSNLDDYLKRLRMYLEDGLISEEDLLERAREYRAVRFVRAFLEGKLEEYLREDVGLPEEYLRVFYSSLV